jgi:hypothetical protein
LVVDDLLFQLIDALVVLIGLFWEGFVALRPLVKDG